MFGLGLLELLVIVGVIALLFGSAGVKKLVTTARTVRDAKRGLTGRAALERLVDSGDEGKTGDDKSS